MPSIPRLPSLLDTALDRTFVGYGNLGYLARRPGWQDELPGLDGRVIWVASGGMYGRRLRADDLQYLRGEYKPTTGYARTKRAQVVLSELWAQELRADGIASHAMHPGWADTPGIAASLPGFRRLTRPILRSHEQGADTVVWLAAADEPGRSSGRFWHDRRERPTHYAGRTREDAADRRALWDACEALTA